jgi:hypothetical protein
MQEEDQTRAPADDHLPGLNTFGAWMKVLGILFALLMMNLVITLTTWGWGWIVSVPLTVFLAFLLFRDLIPRHRLPPGRQPPQSAAG